MSDTIRFELFSDTGANSKAGSHPFVITSLAIFAVFFPSFLYVEASAERPIMPLRFVQKSPHMNIIFSNFLACILGNAIFFNM